MVRRIRVEVRGRLGPRACRGDGLGASESVGESEPASGEEYGGDSAAVPGLSGAPDRADLTTLIC